MTRTAAAAAAAAGEQEEEVEEEVDEYRSPSPTSPPARPCSPSMPPLVLPAPTVQHVVRRRLCDRSAGLLPPPLPSAGAARADRPTRGAPPPL